MNLEDLGYNNEIEKLKDNSFDIARVIAEHKERYIVKTAEKEYDAEILGNLRYSAQSRSDFPAVGDWVAISEYDENKVLIHSIYKRKSSLERQAVGKSGEKQIIAVNIDFAFIVQSVDRDFNINRLERYLAICNSSNVKPIIILSKIDLINEEKLTELVVKIKKRIKDAPLYPISNKTQQGIEALQQKIEKGKTYCLLGSSGVGKSSLLNTISGEDLMKTDVISEFSNRGQHVTTHRELKVLKKGGIIIDNPGMREIGVTDVGEGLEVTFDEIVELSTQCKFKNCTHTTETGCAVLKAVEENTIDRALYENYMKMMREHQHYESTVAEKRKKDKDLAKVVNYYKKSKKRNSL